MTDNEFDRSVEVEALRLHMTETILEVMQKEGVNRTELARRLGVSKARVTQLFSSNMTLQTLAEVMYVLGYYWECEPRKRNVRAG